MKEKPLVQGRRDFIKIGTLAGTGLLVGVHLPNCSRHVEASHVSSENGVNMLAPNAWIRIRSDDTVTVMVNHSELGQGITTALPMIVAEELEADWSKIKVEIAPGEEVYKNPAFNTQMTASSTSVYTSWDILRKAGAMARETLISAAARAWKVPPSECYAQNGAVIHKPSQRSFRFGELVDKTAGIPVPEDVYLKKPEEFKIIGKRIPRLDTKIKTDGSAKFGIDIKLPEMLVAVVVHPPVFGGKVKSVDSQNTRKMKGIRDVVAIDAGIAVVADTFWQARLASDALQIEWEENENSKLNSDALFERWDEMAKSEGKTQYEIGDVDDFFGTDGKTHQAMYRIPYQGHATPEPMNCTAHVRDKDCEIWAPTQHQDAAQEVAARITGFDYEAIKVHTTFVGGGFGRRISVEYVVEAVQISKILKKPIKVIWTREEDTRNDRIRPATCNFMEAAIDSNGLPVAWRHRIVGADVFGQMLPKLIPSIMPYWVPRFLRNGLSGIGESLLPRVVPGKKAIKGAAPLQYNIANVRAEFINDDPGIPIGYWRSVSAFSNAFAVECFLDELAAESGEDPFDYRDRLLTNSPRMREVMKLAADKAGWKEKPPAGVHRGLAIHRFHDTDLCFVAEVSIHSRHEIRVHRVVCAVNCGIVINPKTIESQMESAVAFGLTSTLKSAITIRDGKIEQSNFDDYPILRIDEMPKVEVYTVQDTRSPTSIGEAGVPVIAPAVANAVFAATGIRVRKLPILPDDIKNT